MKMLTIISDAWDKVTSYVNAFFDDYKIRHYIRISEETAVKLGPYLDTLLDGTEYKNYKIIVEDTSEYYRWLKASIRIYIDMPYEKAFKIWDKLCDFAYKDLSKEDSIHIYVQVEPWERIRRKMINEEVDCGNCYYNQCGCRCEELMAASCIPTPIEEANKK